MFFNVAVSIVFAQEQQWQAKADASTGKAARAEKSSVRFGDVRTFSDGRGVFLKWQTNLELNGAGFNVYRARKRKRAAFVPVNRGLISAAYLETGETRNNGRAYSFFDAGGDLNSKYYIESFNLDGRKNHSQAFYPQAINDLSLVAGVSADELKDGAKNANPSLSFAENILPQDLQSEVSLNMTAADAARQLWVAAQPGVKISVMSEGIYRVSRAELQAKGFDVNASFALWQLYANGNEQAINIGEGGAFIEFYGRGLDTPEANAQTYYLIVGESDGKRMAATLRRPLKGRVLSASFNQTFVKKDHFTYTANILNGDKENFFGSVINDGGASVNFNLKSIDFSSLNASLDIGIQGFTTTPHKTKIAVNGHELGTVSVNARELGGGHFNIPTEFLLEGANKLQLTSLLGSSDLTVFESLKINFQRKYQASQNRLSFYTDNYRAVYIENFTSPNIRVFDVTYEDSPSQIYNLQIEQSSGAYRVFLPSNRGRVMYAVEDSAIMSPVSVVANQPSTLTTTNHNADLVIITYKDWAAQALDWAEYRRAQGFAVEVVNVEDIYDEYSFGALSSLAIKNFLQYAANNWQTAPKYVLLLGDATYDPKNYFEAGYNDFIPTRLVDTVYTEAGSDDALADFNDDGLTELSIGRIPVRDAQSATKLLNKVKAFEQTVDAQDGLTRGALFVSDLPNTYDFEALSNRVRQQLPQNIPTVIINRGEANARSRLLSEINKSRFLVNYSGHGTVVDWADSGFFSKNDAPQLANGKLSIFTMLTCLNGYFISPNPTAEGDGLGEALLAAPNGAVASWASSGLTTPDVQEIMATRFYNQIGAGNFTRLGDLVKDAKTEVKGGRDVRLSWVLLGDPTLKVR